MDYVKLYVDEKMTLHEVSEKTKIPVSTLRFRLLKIGALRTLKESQVLAASLGRKSRHAGKPKIISEECRKNMSISAKNRWHGKSKGTSVKPSGYIEYTTGENKGRSVHVVKIESHIGRKLFHNECVHHKDGNRANNELSNLQLMTKSEHSRLHAKENLDNRERNKIGQFK